MVKGLEVRSLSVTFHTGQNEKLYAVSDVSISLVPGEIVGLVGESGCGKSVTAKAILGLIRPPRAILGGEVVFEGRNLISLPESEMRRIRGRKISLIPQNPLSSLNPLMTIGYQVAESVMQHFGEDRKNALKLAREMLDKVGFPAGEEHLKRYPNEFSGGMRQRIAIAMALISKPDIIIADEPTTALDVTIQAQILNLLKSLVKDTGVSVLLITHDLSVVLEICDKVAVMYAGQIVEWGATWKVLRHPSHPYTAALIAALPYMAKEGVFSYIPGQPPRLGTIPNGCYFSDRCQYVDVVCRSRTVPYTQHLEGDGVRCLRPLTHS